MTHWYLENAIISYKRTGRGLRVLFLVTYDMFVNHCQGHQQGESSSKSETVKRFQEGCKNRSIEFVLYWPIPSLNLVTPLNISLMILVWLFTSLTLHQNYSVFKCWFRIKFYGPLVCRNTLKLQHRIIPKSDDMMTISHRYCDR